jgi:hypothetical protein
MIMPFVYIFTAIFALAPIGIWGLHLFFVDRREARQREFEDRQAARSHETKLAVEILAVAQATNTNISALDEHVRVNLSNFKTALVETLKSMHEIVKDSDSERKRVAGKAVATLMHPGKRLPLP